MATHEKLSREEVAKREIGHTAVTRGQSWMLIGVFLLTAIAVPVIQFVLDRSNEEKSDRPGWAEVAQAWRLGALPQTVKDSERGETRDVGPWRRFKVANDQLLVNIHTLEDEQKLESFLTQGLVTPFQTATTRTLGLGNEKGYPGRDGWAFFRAGVDSVTGPGFLDPKQLERRANSGSEWVPAPEPDPRPAILEFHAYLAERGIDLVLVPIPVKPVVHPEMLSARYAADSPPVRNPSFATWMEEMEQAGVRVVDVAPQLTARKADGPQFLETDTHWTPGAMEAVASAIAEAIGPAPGTNAYRHTREEVTALGDVAANLLKLEGTGVYPKQTVVTHPVVSGEGEPWREHSDAEVLLLGDSFANIYSSTNLNWGEGAGLAEQLSLAWQTDVDVIGINDSGAKATREALAKELWRTDRLAGKRIVVWEFASRELAVGDWKRIDWRAIQVPAEASSAVLKGMRKIRGRIEQISRPPVPGTVTYKDCLIQAHLVEVDGLDDTDEILLNLWGMRDNKWVAAARYEAGTQLTLNVMDWGAAREERGIKGLMQRELEDEDFVLIELPLYWGEPTQTTE